MSWFQRLFKKKEPEPVKPVMEDEDVTEEESVEVPKGRQFITGDDVTYVVPHDMRLLKVQIQESNGRIMKEYTLTQYMDINPGNRFRIISK